MLLVFVFTPSLGLTLFGSVLTLLPPPDPALVPLGSIMANVGLLGVSITLCILGIPYSMLRLRKALSVKAGGIGMSWNTSCFLVHESVGNLMRDLKLSE
uniref:Uncharacterized protein n=1 Tax=Oryza nivara TaxID=4536 RepID=A0A0E0IBX4_ORYNI